MHASKNSALHKGRLRVQSSLQSIWAIILMWSLLFGLGHLTGLRIPTPSLPSHAPQA